MNNDNNDNDNDNDNVRYFSNERTNERANERLTDRPDERPKRPIQAGRYLDYLFHISELSPRVQEHVEGRR